MRVFVTGHRGYIGAHLTPLLRAAGHWVTGCDLDLFEGCEWGVVEPPDRELRRDVRMVSPDDLSGHDCVMHLAAISNDPMGALDPAVTYSVNRDGSINLAGAAKAAGVPRFLFASSCAMYGQAGRLDVEESAPLCPVSAYAESKVAAEGAICALADDAFSPVFLRNATAFGLSPMFRLDLVANNLLACAIARGDIRVTSDGTPWRPLIHCRDIARAFVAILETPRELTHNLPINIGADAQNYQVKDVAAVVRGLVPDAQVVFTGETGPDPRNYRVSFARLRALLPRFTLSQDLASGLRELHEAMLARGFGRADFDGPKYVRLRTLQGRLDRLGGPAQPR